MTDTQIICTFMNIRNRGNFAIVVGRQPVEVQYLFAKAHKIANADDFFDYWCDGRAKQPLCDILNKLYEVPPHYLKFNHDEKDGMIRLSRFVAIAKTIF